MSNTKRIVFLKLTLLFCMLFFSIRTFAGDNSCQTNGGTKQYSFDMGVKTITDPSQDAAGTTLENAFTWDSSGDFKVTCSCSGDYTPHYKGSSELPLGHADDKQYYKINDSIEVSTAIYLSTTAGNEYYSVPFSQVSNSSSIDCNGHSYSSGSRGTVSLYISKPFVGSVVIPSSKIASLYISPTNVFTSGSVADIFLSGSIVAPQNCVINSGTAITVDLGSINSSSFQLKGEKPAGYNPKQFSFNIKCNDISSQATLSISLQASPAEGSNTVISSTNKDIGVVIADNKGNPLAINSQGVIDFNLDSNYESDVQLMAWPTSATGNKPEAGSYQSTALLNVVYK